MGFKFKPINLKQKRYDYGNLHNEISDDDFDDYHDYKEEEFINISHMPPLDGDEEEVKEGKSLKIFGPIKLLNRLSIILAQT